MRAMFLPVILLTVWLFPPAVEAQRRLECKNLRNGLPGIERMAEEFMLKVEGVPPKDAEYLEREISASLKLEDRRRFGAAQQHPKYYAFQVHKAYEPVKEHVKRALAEPSIKSAGLLWLKALKDYSELLTALSDYTSNLPISGDMARSLHFESSIVRLLIAGAIECHINALTEPN